MYLYFKKVLVTVSEPTNSKHSYNNQETIMSSDNIYIILSSKPNNEHYLKRYYKFILLCTLANKNLSKCDYTENQ
jgi:hypothetical protein